MFPLFEIEKNTEEITFHDGNTRSNETRGVSARHPRHGREINVAKFGNVDYGMICILNSKNF